MRLTRRGRLLVWFIAGLMAWGAGNAYANTLSRWAHYRAPHEMDLIVRTRCLNAEDSAAHLKLVEYDPANGRVVYGCERGGY